MHTSKFIHERLSQVLVSWEKLRPTKSFAGMSLEQFREAVAPAVQLKQRLGFLRNELEAGRAQLLESDRQLFLLLGRVVSGVKADIEEGPDGDLYDAMGFVRTSMRRTGLKRPRKSSSPAPRGDGSVPLRAQASSTDVKAA